MILSKKKILIGKEEGKEINMSINKIDELNLSIN